MVAIKHECTWKLKVQSLEFSPMLVSMEIPPDQNSPKWTYTANWIWNLAYIHIHDIENPIVCCIETYFICIYHMSKCSTSNWSMYIEGFCMRSVWLDINWLSPNIAHLCLNKPTLMENKVSFIKLLTIFVAVFLFNWWCNIPPFFNWYGPYICELQREHPPATAAETHIDQNKTSVWVWHYFSSQVLPVSSSNKALTQLTF